MDKNTCPSGKRYYATKVEADMMLHYIRSPHAHASNSLRKRKRKERSSYHCKQCQGWHLTSISPVAQY